MYIVYRVLSIYRVLPGFREFAVFEKIKRFLYFFLDGRYREGVRALARALARAQIVTKERVFRVRRGPALADYFVKLRDKPF